MRSFVIASCLVAGCAAPPSAPAAPCPSVPPQATASAPATVDAGAPPPAACRAREARTTEAIAMLTDMLRNPEAGALRTEHGDLFRLFPTLHETAFVLSIAPTHASGVFAVTFLPRGSKEAHLGFAKAACPDGDLAFATGGTPLGVEHATVQYVTRVPLAHAMSELQIETGEARSPKPRFERPRQRSVVVDGTRVVGSIELDADLPPERGIRGRDAHLTGSGWYAQGDGAAYLLVHRVEHDGHDACGKKPLPNARPALRIVARIDRDGAFTTEEAKMGSAFAIAIGKNQPPEALKSCRTGPTAVGGGGIEQGPPAQWLCGLYATAEEARKANAGTVVTTEPRAGQPSPKEPWQLDVRFRSPSGLDCVGVY